MTTARAHRPLGPHFDIEALLKSMDAIKYGVVHWFNTNQGFGFITPDDGGPDIFVHHSEIGDDGPQALEEGQRISYRVGGTHEQPQAETVHVL